MSNRKIGNGFEQEFAEILSRHGYWVHIIAQRSEGQPADIIAVKNGRAYLIDCKVCSTVLGFKLSRLEENQDLSMSLWRDVGNGEAWFAIRMGEAIYMFLHSFIKNAVYLRARLTPKDIKEEGISLEEWLDGNN